MLSGKAIASDLTSKKKLVQRSCGKFMLSHKQPRRQTLNQLHRFRNVDDAVCGKRLRTTFLIVGCHYLIIYSLLNINLANARVQQMRPSCARVSIYCDTIIVRLILRAAANVNDDVQLPIKQL